MLILKIYNLRVYTVPVVEVETLAFLFITRLVLQEY